MRGSQGLKTRKKKRKKTRKKKRNKKKNKKRRKKGKNKKRTRKKGMIAMDEEEESRYDSYSSMKP